MIHLSLKQIRSFAIDILPQEIIIECHQDFVVFSFYNVFSYKHIKRRYIEYIINNELNK